MSARDGGPAFGGYIRMNPPAGGYHGLSDSSYDVPVMGMSLLDYFAGEAMKRALPIYQQFEGHPSCAKFAAEVARSAYALAQAMIEERERLANPNMAPGAPKL